jgi:hypothetical protein
MFLIKYYAEDDANEDDKSGSEYDNSGDENEKEEEEEEGEDGEEEVEEVEGQNGFSFAFEFAQKKLLVELFISRTVQRHQR